MRWLGDWSWRFSLSLEFSIGWWEQYKMQKCCWMEGYWHSNSLWSREGLTDIKGTSVKLAAVQKPHPHAELPNNPNMNGQQLELVLSKMIDEFLEVYIMDAQNSQLQSCKSKVYGIYGPITATWIFPTSGSDIEMRDDTDDTMVDPWLSQWCHLARVRHGLNFTKFQVGLDGLGTASWGYTYGCVSRTMGSSTKNSLHLDLNLNIWIIEFEFWYETQVSPMFLGDFKDSPHGFIGQRQNMGSCDDPSRWRRWHLSSQSNLKIPIG